MNLSNYSSHAFPPLLTLLICLTICGSIGDTLTASVARAEACQNQSLRNGLSQSLPDCRAFEQVSPAAKGGFNAINQIINRFPAQAAKTGEGVVYMGNGPFLGATGSFLPDAHLSSRDKAGWQTSDVTPSSSVATLSTGLSAGLVGYDFSEDLSQMVAKVVSPPIVGNEQFYNLFLYRNGGSSPVNTVAPSEFAPEGEECYAYTECFAYFDLAAFAGASSNFDRILFEANDSLVGTGAPPGFVENLYESSAGEIHLVGILPDGSIAPGGAKPGAGGGFTVNATALTEASWSDVNHAISADGTRIFWTDPSTGALYVRENNSQSDAKTVLVAEGGQFWTATSDGSDVFYTKAGDLYNFDVASEQTTPITAGAEVLGVVGGSEDGAYIYFVAAGQLVSGKGAVQQPNLYLWHEDATTHATELKFIATLAEGDSADWTATPARLRSYVTPDGLHLAFTSLNSLTGYDNHDSASHETDTEIYEYSAGNNTLACASCDPTGAPPVGSAFIGATTEELKGTAFYQPRILSDDGTRLFFSSPDALLPGNTTPSTKLYEYEQPGAGSCEAVLRGCLYRVSSGSSGAGGPDIFLDADATGSNVFFASLSRLAPTDTDNLYDVYDARVGGGIATPAGAPSCLPGCLSDGVSAPPTSSPPRSQEVLGSTSAQPGTNKTAKHLTCQTKARKLASRKSRTRALKRCHKQKHASHGRAR